MNLARRFKKILSTSSEITNSSYDIKTLTRDQLVEYVKEESKTVRDFIGKLEEHVDLLEVYNNLDNMDISIVKRVVVKNWFDRHGFEFLSLGVLPEYNWKSVIGKGSFSTAHLVCEENKYMKNYKVVKITKIDKDRNDILAFREISLLRNISHPYIIKLYSFGNVGNRLWCLLEYCFLGSLIDFGIPMNYTLRYRCISHCIEGIAYLHSRKVMHRDIKCGNIFVKGEEPHIMFKLGDFNLAKDFSEDSSSKTWSRCGTMNYMAPELLSNKVYDERCDLWSFLCVILEINLDKQPMFNPITLPTEELKKKAEFSEVELTILTMLHKIIPEERATAKDVNNYILSRPLSPPIPSGGLRRIRSASLDTLEYDEI